MALSADTSSMGAIAQIAETHASGKNPPIDIGRRGHVVGSASQWDIQVKSEPGALQVSTRESTCVVYWLLDRSASCSILSWA